MPFVYTHQEYGDIVYVYGLCDGNATAAVLAYQARFPNRRIPSAQDCETGSWSLHVSHMNDTVSLDNVPDGRLVYDSRREFTCFNARISPHASRPTPYLKSVLEWRTEHYKMPYKFSTTEYADIVYVYGLCGGSTSHAVTEYERHFPNRRVPYRRVFTIYCLWGWVLYDFERIPNLTGEQSDGITVFRIPPMTSLMLHRCRTGAINLQRWWQSPSAAISESDWFLYRRSCRVVSGMSDDDDDEEEEDEEGRRGNPVLARSLLLSNSTKRAARLNVPIRRTNHY
ncbi:hypothetical protein ANN_10924 [Periplaneta americana]|uniref:DUF4817 domain-containing protein n=1 Tax=Periplaneta americana TaxID=6978 RepID=A0ABQ8T3L3_PERAM|nr:hypothetical protein ANN_10924 [Periplaneta americana]